MLLRYEVELLDLDLSTRLTKWDIKAEERYDCAVKSKEDEKISRKTEGNISGKKFDAAIDIMFTSVIVW